MPITITMPRLSDTMEAGTILKWNIKEGDEVSSGDVIADVETDKATMELAAFEDGVVAKLAVPVGKSVSVGTVIAVLAEKGEDIKDATMMASNGEPERAAPPTAVKKKTAEKTIEPDAGQPKPARPIAEAEVRRRPLNESNQPPAHATIEHDPIDESSDADQSARTRISPVARHLAEEHGINLRSLKGSGPGGRIIKRDVMQAVEGTKENVSAVAPAAVVRHEDQGSRTKNIATRVQATSADQNAAMGAPGIMQDRSIQLSGMRQTIARRLVESKTTIPHYQVTATFNMDPILGMRTQLNEQLESQGVKLSLNDFLVRACALAMYRHPEFNASWAPEGDHIKVHGDINIGIAISIPVERGGGLVVGSIRNADQKSLRVISFESKNLAEKARSRGLSLEEMGDTTFTISNLGMFGVDNFNAIINPPNSAILAVGAAIEKPVVRDHQLAVGHEMSATISCDHRVIDGAMAALYLQTVRSLIEQPAALVV